MTTTQTVVPERPFRGIHSFRYADRSVFFARARETIELVQLVSVYRGVLLYGDSGAGKSSLVNAGLIPTMEELGYTPERYRLQPREGEELVLEPIEDGGGRGPSPAPEVRSLDALEERCMQLAEGERRLLIFDQFEEIVTLFQEAPQKRPVSELLAIQESIIEALVRLLNNATLRVKLVFVFREDYLGHVVKLFALAPYLRDQYLRLTPPRVDALLEIIRGPFDKHPGEYDTEISPALADELADALAKRATADEVNLSEVQIVCLRLWRARDPKDLFDQRGVPGLLEDHMGEALSDLGEEDKYAAVALLSRMITTSGARNVISEEDLVERVKEDTGLRERKLKKTLQLLEKAAVVRREQRYGRPFYEIVSEFLIPWIVRQRQQRIEREQLDQLLRQITQQELQYRYRVFQAFRVRNVVTIATIAIVILITLGLVLHAIFSNGVPFWQALILITAPLAALALVQLLTTQRYSHYRQEGAHLAAQRQRLESLVHERGGLTGGQVTRVWEELDEYAASPYTRESQASRD
jgi:Novel STAND NTPase 1